MEISGNQFLVKNKTTHGQAKVDDKTSVAKSEGETSTARSEQIKDSSASGKDTKYAITTEHGPMGGDEINIISS